MDLELKWQKNISPYTQIVIWFLRRNNKVIGWIIEDDPYFYAHLGDNTITPHEKRTLVRLDLAKQWIEERIKT